MQTIKLEEIKKGKNVRVDYGDLNELAASIKTNGIRHPVELDKDCNLIDGFRRMGAVALINKEGVEKIEDIPFFINDKPLDVVEEQLISGIFQKNLTPLEEAKAYDEYVKKTNRSVDTLAKKLGKTKAYVERRLILLQLGDKILTALDKKQIEIGHANLLAQMTHKQQNMALREIVDYDLTVQNFADQIRWMKKIDFGDIQFRQSKRYDKTQTTLTEIGVELYPKNDQNILRDEKAFKKDIADYVASQRKTLKEKGITVFSNQDNLIKKHPKAIELSEFDSKLDYDYAKIVCDLPKRSGEFGVVVDFDYGLEKVVFALDGDLFKQELKNKDKQEKEINSSTDTEEADKMLALNREEKLNRKVTGYKTDFLRDITNELIQCGTKESKALVAYAMYSSLSWEDKDRASKTLKLGKIEEHFFKKVLKRDAKDLETDIHFLSAFWIKGLFGKGLQDLAISCGLDFKKHFEVNENFLKLFQKSQLIDLAKELSVKVNGLVKNKDISTAILNANITGKVPQVLKAA